MNGASEQFVFRRMLPGAVAASKRFEPRRAVTSLAAAALGGVAALYLTTDTSRGASLTTIGIALGAVLLGWMFFTSRVELALAISIGYVGLLDGFVRLKTGSSTLTMGRDAFLYAVAMGMLIRAGIRRERWRWPPLTVWVVGWTVFVLVQLLNPASGPTLHRIASLRQDLEFVPLFFLGYAVVRSRDRLRSLAILLLAIAAVNGVVGLYQSTLSPSQLASWGPGYAALLHGTNGAPTTAVGANGQPIVRPPALGGDMGFAGAMGMIALPAGLALLLIRRRRRAEKIVFAILLICATVGLISSESRADIISSVVGLFAFGAMLAAGREGRKLLIALVISGAVLVAASSVVSGNSLARYASITPGNLGTTVTSSRSNIGATIEHYLLKYPFGGGIGSSGPAWNQFGASAHTLDGETQITFLIGEVGIPGLLLFLAFQLRAVGSFVRRLRLVRDSELHILLAALIAPLFAFMANWYVGINTTAPPNATYMWGAMGVLSFWLLARHPHSADSGGS